MRRRGVAAWVALAAIALGCAHADPTRSAQALRDADRARLAAMVDVDVPTLQAALHPELVYVHSNGKVDGRSSLIASLASREVDYVKITPGLEPTLRMRGGTAILTNATDMRVVAAGATHDLAMLYTAAYWHEDGRWQLVAYQSVALPDAP